MNINPLPKDVSFAQYSTLRASKCGYYKIDLRLRVPSLSLRKSQKQCLAWIAHPAESFSTPLFVILERRLNKDFSIQNQKKNISDYKRMQTLRMATTTKKRHSLGASYLWQKSMISATLCIGYPINRKEFQDQSGKRDHGLCRRLLHDLSD